MRQLPLWALVLSLGVGLASIALDADAKTKRKSGGKSKASFSQGSSESTKERDNRLTRECRGRPNSGACTGYARP
jgi:hypothetical protein